MHAGYAMHGLPLLLVIHSVWEHPINIPTVAMVGNSVAKLACQCLAAGQYIGQGLNQASLEIFTIYLAP